MLGCAVLDEVLKPTAMSPFLSTARLPIHRQRPSFGTNVFCCSTEGVPVMLPIWYHRTPPWPLTETEWLNHNVPSGAICSWYIARSESESKALPPCSGTDPRAW